MRKQCGLFYFMEEPEVKTEEQPSFLSSVVTACRACSHRRFTVDLADGICADCRKIMEGKEKIFCIDCGRSAEVRKLQKRGAKKRVVGSKFFIEGRCLPCHKKLLRVQREDSLFDVLKDEIVLTDEEKQVVEAEHGTNRLPFHIIEEMLIRLAAGQYVHDVCDSLNSQYNLGLNAKHPSTLYQCTRRKAFQPILQRLRAVFNDKKTCEYVPITNKFQLALRLEKLYQEAETVGNIRDRVLILKTANEMLMMEDGKAPQQANFFTIIQRIEASNKAQRMITANFNEPLALPSSRLERLEDSVNGTRIDGTELRSAVSVEK